MKKHLIIILFLFFALITSGQTSHSIVDTNRLWSIDLGIMYANPYPHFVWHTEYVKFSGDTIIGLNHYKKVVESEDSNMNTWQVQRFIREDSSKRTYMINVGVEYLLYDFNASVGDSLLVGFIEQKIVLTNIDSIYIYNKYYKRFTFSSGESWLDNIGSSGGVLYSGEHGSGWTVLTDLLCYSENDTLKYSPNGTCYINSNVREITRDKFSIVVFPNPILDKINLQIPQQFGQTKTLEIFDCLGQLQLKRSEGFSEVDISSLAKGLYLIVLTNGDNERLVSKILKE
jgi:hypothetical protein